MILIYSVSQPVAVVLVTLLISAENGKWLISSKECRKTKEQPKHRPSLFLHHVL
jgi:hypothetical protein